MSENLTGLQGPGGWRFSSFRRTLQRLVGETVRIQTNDSAFSGKLASVQTTFVTLAGGSTPPHIHLVYIPIRHINAVTAS